jgi:hypothetical protein
MIYYIFSGIIINAIIINATNITNDLILNISTSVIPFMFYLKIELRLLLLLLELLLLGIEY